MPWSGGVIRPSALDREDVAGRAFEDGVVGPEVHRLPGAAPARDHLAEHGGEVVQRLVARERRGHEAKRKETDRDARALAPTDTRGSTGVASIIVVGRRSAGGTMPNGPAPRETVSRTAASVASRSLARRHVDARQPVVGRGLERDAKDPGRAGEAPEVLRQAEGRAGIRAHGLEQAVAVDEAAIERRDGRAARRHETDR
jgi:hypothetical protein